MGVCELVSEAAKGAPSLIGAVIQIDHRREGRGLIAAARLQI